MANKLLTKDATQKGVSYVGKIMEYREIPGEGAVYLCRFDELDNVSTPVPVVIHRDGYQFTPHDWQAGYEDVPEDLSSIKWISQDGQPAIMLDGLPRVLGSVPLTPQQWVNTWDKQDITDLIGLIGDGDGVDLSDLPSAVPVPESLTTYPVWAIDAAGCCLVGAGCDKLEELADILEWHSEKIQPQEYTISGFDKLEKTVSPGNATSGRIFLPKSWEGSRVSVIRMDP